MTPVLCSKPCKSGERSRLRVVWRAKQKRFFLPAPLKSPDAADTWATLGLGYPFQLRVVNPRPDREVVFRHAETCLGLY